MLCDQQGYVLCDQNGDLCFKETDEDELALLTQPVLRSAPILAEQVNAVVEQNQQLQSELEQSMLAHRNDAEHTQEMMKQRDVQFQSDFRAMQAEFARRQAEWAETSQVERDK